MKQKTSSFICMMLLACVFVLSGYTASAQQDATRQNDPVKSYMTKRPNSPAVKLFQANPGNAELAKAVKLEMILDNPGGYPEFSSSVIERMRGELTIMNQQFKLVNEMVEQGATYEQAKVRAAEQSKSIANPSKEEAPSMMVSPQ